MNPLSFVTAFTIGELGTMFALVLAFDGGLNAPVFHSHEARHMLFWLFLGGFVWVIGDLFQQFATKYLGIGRGIPLSNTNQIWGVAWGALVFGELAHADTHHRFLVIAGTVLMVLGALAVSTAVATAREHSSTHDSLLRECYRYGLDYDSVIRAYAGLPSLTDTNKGKAKRSWWDYLIVSVAVGSFVYLGIHARVPTIALNFTWLWILSGLLVITALACGYALWKVTRFS